MRRLPGSEFFLPPSTEVRRFERRVKRAAAQALGRKDGVLHLTHGGCFDGATCDALVRIAATVAGGDDVASADEPSSAREAPDLASTSLREEDVATVFLEPAETLDALRLVAPMKAHERRLLLSDLSLQKGQESAAAEVVAQAIASGWRVEWRDHHARQWDETSVARLAGTPGLALRIDFSGSECGATLVQKDLLPRSPFAAEIAGIARDHDLWILKDPRSMRLEAATRGLGSERFSRRLAAERRIDDPAFQSAADAVEARKKVDIAWGVRRAHIHEGPGPLADSMRVGTAFGNIPTNEVLHALIVERGCAVGVLFKPDGKFSLRSRKGVDVCHEIAQAFGGGGHPNASGGKIILAPLAWPAFWIRQDGHPAARAVVEKALSVLAARSAPT
ncbi:MAG: hypothetical protein ACYDDF_14025 [Thermoplasmatota archaeon]